VPSEKVALTILKPLTLLGAAKKLVGGGLVHRLREMDPPGVKLGMKVEAIFVPAEEEVGSVLDIRYFQPQK